VLDFTKNSMAPSALLPEPEPEYVVVHAGKGTIKRQILTGDQKKPTFETIPQVDFSNMGSSSIEERRAVAKEVGAAFRDSGFLYAVNHGVSEELQSDLFRVIKEFFDLPLEKKMKVEITPHPKKSAIDKIRSMSISPIQLKDTRHCLKRNWMKQLEAVGISLNYKLMYLTTIARFEGSVRNWRGPI
jgi:hypothetical protein